MQSACQALHRSAMSEYDSDSFSVSAYTHLKKISYRNALFSAQPDLALSFSGVLYQKRYGKLNLWYYIHYKDGLRDGAEVHFYESGKVKNYRVLDNGRLVGKNYVWNENGKIDSITDWDQREYVDFDENGEIIEQGKL